jgi:hypothetical protein
MIQDTHLNEALQMFFRGEGVFERLGLNKLDENYIWPKRGDFPSLSGETFEGNNYSKNIQLKEKFPDKWNNSNGDNEKFDLAKWIIKDWGGIKRNKDETILNHLKITCKSNDYFPLKGVASYSKILSFIEPDNFAIYDARVAASLNGIQLLSKSKKPVLWNNLDGQNIKIELFKKTLASNNKLRSLGWAKIRSDECYKNYIYTLKNILEKFPNFRLFHLEMSLFACSEEIADLCLNSNN